MRRLATEFLDSWLDSDDCKPLVLRGARQVGKTWLIRDFAKSHDRQLIELNFEKNARLANLFGSNDPRETLLKIEAALHIDIDPKKSLLFLDEIQSAPEIFAKLRWFAEDLPDLPVVAAGSLLEFLLHDHEFSVPVGRIGYMHLEPLSFEEYLSALDRPQLLRFIEQFTFEMEMPDEIHHQLTTLFSEYMFVGGMPAAVSSWIKHRSLPKVTQIHENLLATYRDDFRKYTKRLSPERLEEVLACTPRMLGQKFVFSRVNAQASPDSIKRAVTLLNQARVCHSVVSTAANGIPLASEAKPKFFKEIFLDTGLCCTSLDTSLHDLNEVNDITMINSGGLAEQIVGQLLRTINPFYVEPTLHYWLREEPNSNAELDYVIQHKGKIVPIEVKAGARGTLKSLTLFMTLKQLSLALRICSAPPNVTKNTFTLVSIPFYLCGQIHRLLDDQN